MLSRVRPVALTRTPARSSLLTTSPLRLLPVNSPARPETVHHDWPAGATTTTTAALDLRVTSVACRRRTSLVCGLLLRPCSKGLSSPSFPRLLARRLFSELVILTSFTFTVLRALQLGGPYESRHDCRHWSIFNFRRKPDTCPTSCKAQAPSSKPNKQQKQRDKQRWTTTRTRLDHRSKQDKA